MGRSGGPNPRPSQPPVERMTRRLIIRPEAEADLTDAAEWYDSREPDLGLKLVSEVHSAILRVLKNPESFTLCSSQSDSPSCSRSTVSISNFLHRSARCSRRFRRASRSASRSSLETACIPGIVGQEADITSN
jgi:hypothetical protein